jgi:hypothetical protein
MAVELSQAGEDFGKAFCLSPDRAVLPLDQLTPEERACVTRVGTDFEARVQERMGFSPQDGVGYHVTTPAGARVATLGMDSQGNVTLCLPGQRCVVVGQGPAAAASAEETLALLGLQVGTVPTTPTGGSIPSPMSSAS